MAPGADEFDAILEFDARWLAAMAMPAYVPGYATFFKTFLSFFWNPGESGSVRVWGGDHDGRAAKRLLSVAPPPLVGAEGGADCSFLRHS